MPPALTAAPILPEYSTRVAVAFRRKFMKEIYLGYGTKKNTICTVSVPLNLESKSSVCGIAPCVLFSEELKSKRKYIFYLLESVTT